MRLGRIASIAAAVAVITLAVLLFPGAAAQQQNDSSGIWHCGLDDIGATLTLCKTGAVDGQRLYITDIFAQSTTTTSGLFLIRYGTGTNCGTGTTSVWPLAATVARYNYQPNTGLPSLFNLVTPIEIPTGKDICVICTGTNTCTIDLLGTVKP